MLHRRRTANPARGTFRVALGYDLKGLDFPGWSWEGVSSLDSEAVSNPVSRKGLQVWMEKMEKATQVPNLISSLKPSLGDSDHQGADREKERDRERQR